MLTYTACSTQEAYEKNVTTLFKSLDRAEEHLRTTDGPYYYGEHITEADVRLFTTIIRFDVVYVQHFKVRPRPPLPARVLRLRTDRSPQ